MLFWVYLAGVGIGLFMTDAPIGGRVLHALLWPVGVLAFAVTIPLLLAAGLVMFPLVGAGVAAAALTGWYFLT